MQWGFAAFGGAFGCEVAARGPATRCFAARVVAGVLFATPSIGSLTGGHVGLGQLVASGKAPQLWMPPARPSPALASPALPSPLGRLVVGGQAPLLWMPPTLPPPASASLAPPSPPLGRALPTAYSSAAAVPVASAAGTLDTGPATATVHLGAWPTPTSIGRATAYVVASWYVAALGAAAGSFAACLAASAHIAARGIRHRTPLLALLCLPRPGSS